MGLGSTSNTSENMDRQSLGIKNSFIDIERVPVKSDISNAASGLYGTRMALLYDKITLVTFYYYSTCKLKN